MAGGHDEPALELDSPEGLMCAFLDGDSSAFERLFRLLAPRVASALAQMSEDTRLAEDLTQVAFLKMYRARDSYQRGMLVAPWLFAIARNTFKDHQRTSGRRPESLSRDGTLPEVSTEQPFDTSALDDILRALPASQREALLLLKVQGLSVTEAAALCGTSTASIKMRAHRAYRSLRDRFVERTRP
jgi:RNA polymerase sigma-70 factor, ECF subfamily